MPPGHPAAVNVNSALVGLRKKRLVLFLINDKCSTRWPLLKPQHVERETKIIPVILDRRRARRHRVERRSKPVRLMIRNHSVHAKKQEIWLPLH